MLKNNIKNVKKNNLVDSGVLSNKRNSFSKKLKKAEFNVWIILIHMKYNGYYSSKSNSLRIFKLISDLLSFLGSIKSNSKIG